MREAPGATPVPYVKPAVVSLSEEALLGSVEACGLTGGGTPIPGKSPGLKSLTFKKKASRSGGQVW